MSSFVLFGEFMASLALVSIAGYVMTVQIERLGGRLAITPGLLGLLVALGADSPELASAISALAHGHGDVGAGVVLGSNIFNIGALLGVGAVISRGGIQVRRPGLVLMGGPALAITLLGVGLVLGQFNPVLMMILFGAILIPYVWLSSLNEARIKTVTLPEPLRTFLLSALVEVEEDAPAKQRRTAGGAFDLLSIVPTLAAIVGGSVVMVDRAIGIGSRWRLPGALVGALGLATLTGIPNFVAALRLARRGRGTVVMSETLNSNSFNVIFGLGLSAAITGASDSGIIGRVSAVWLPIMTLAALGLSWPRRGMNRKAGVVLIAIYVGFVTTVLALR